MNQASSAGDMRFDCGQRSEGGRIGRTAIFIIRSAIVGAPQ
jgi:hypothetical protein